MQKLSLIAKTYISAVVATGLAVLVNGLLHGQSRSPLELLALLAMTLMATRLKVKLPGANGTMSMNVPFLLFVAVRLSSSEAVLVAAVAGLVQSLPLAQRRTSLVQGIFNSAIITCAVGAAALAYSFAAHRGLVLALAVALAGAAFFFVNTILMAGVLRLAEGQNLLQTWLGMARLSVPYYILSAAIAAVICTATQFATYAEALALLPLMYSVYSSYRVYFKAAADLEVKSVVHVAAAAQASRSAVVS
jgi:hypothetical protein